ncbi:MAG: 2-dehydropantoate 2-reductase [Dehalococcoidia bacterium]|jgi:2-dehydropantoate 2-reductase
MQRQRIAVIGSGALGTYYGARLAEPGHDVHFLMRRDYHAIRSGGLHVTSPEGDLTLTHLNIYKSSTEIGPVDWIICALKSTSIDEAQKLLAPCIDKNTRILVLMNGLGLEERFAAWFGAKRIFGGMAFTCINRGEPGHTHHLAYGPITIGHFQDDKAELAKALDLWSQSKVTIFQSSCLLQSRWEKLGWNIPFSGLAVAAGGITTDRIMEDAGLNSAARTLMAEVLSTGNADLEHHSQKTRIDQDVLMDLFFKSTSTMGAYKPSTMIDFVEGRAMEIEAIFGEPLRRAQSMDVLVPQLALLTSLLRALNHGR